MIKKLRKIALGTVAIAAVIALFATGPEVAQVWSQAANAQTSENPFPPSTAPTCKHLTPSGCEAIPEIVNKEYLCSMSASL